MYAVIESGGKQYRVSTGDIIEVESLEGDVGSKVELDRVLFVSEPKGETSDVVLGKPTIDGGKVTAQVVGQGRGDKIIVFKRKTRKQYRRKQGHRQEKTQLLITELNAGGKSATLPASDLKSRVTSFVSYLREKGLAQTPKTLGSRKKMKAQAEASKK